MRVHAAVATLGLAILLTVETPISSAALATATRADEMRASRTLTPVPYAVARQRALDSLSAVDIEGRHWSPETLRGRVVLLDFWATWCAPCLEELPVVAEARRRYGPMGFEVIGISLDASDRRTLVGWLRRHGIDWPQIHERNAYAGELARSFRVRGLPTNLLVDREGRLIAADLRGRRLLAALERVLGR